MKNVCGILVVIFFLLITSCKQKVELTSNISTTLQEGSWRITYFVDSTQNETSHFTGFGFAFGADQVITAIKDSVTVTGEWHTGDDNDLTNLVIDFNDAIDFRDLNADWDAYELNDSEVKLRYFDHAGNDFLTFAKN